MLGELHCALDEYPGELPAGGPFDDTAHAIDALAARGLVTAGEADGLREAADRLRTALAGYPVRPLHGDAHPGNLLATPAGLLWNDFEDTCAGPVEWDLACLARTRRFDGDVAVERYGHPGQEALDPYLRLRGLHGTVWYQQLAERFPAYRPDARARLAAWRLAFTS